MQIDRSTHPILTEDDLQEFVDSLKDMEIATLTKCIGEHEDKNGVSLILTMDKLLETISDLNYDASTLQQDVVKVIKKLNAK